MHRIVLRASALLALLGPLPGALAQAEYEFVFQGNCYQTNSTGNVAVTAVTSQLILADRAQGLGIQDLSTIALVYHVNGDEKGDTVEVVNRADGSKLAFQFGFWFGSDASLGRYALTNGTDTEVKRVDHLYTLENATYSSAQSHSVGTAAVTKRFMTDNHGNVRPTIEGPMEWIVSPGPNNSTKVCAGSFTIGKLVH